MNNKFQLVLDLDAANIIGFALKDVQRTSRIQGHRDRARIAYDALDKAPEVYARPSSSLCLTKEPFPGVVETFELQQWKLGGMNSDTPQWTTNFICDTAKSAHETIASFTAPENWRILRITKEVV